MKHKRCYLSLANLSEENRRTIANEIKDEEVLDELADDPSTSVRRTVAGNFFASFSTLEKLQQDEDEEVRLMAQRTLEVLLCG